jgi:hypothetical protein
MKTLVDLGNKGQQYLQVVQQARLMPVVHKEKAGNVIWWREYPWGGDNRIRKHLDVQTLGVLYNTSIIS